MTKEHFNECKEEARRALEENLSKIANKEYTLDEGQIILLSSIAVLQILTIEAITGFEVTELKEYYITWKYIVQKMEERFGIKPDSTEKISMHEIERRMDSIWNEFICEVIKQVLDKQKLDDEVTE